VGLGPLGNREVPEMNFKLKDIDPELRTIITRLNSMGYETLYSCAGAHQNTVRETVDKEELRKAAKSLGLKYVKIRYHSQWYDPLGNIPVTTLRFTGLGGPSSEFG